MGAHELDLDLDPDQRAGLVKSVKGAVAGISHEDAEDAVQDAWLVVAEKADRLEPGPIGGYLRGTARNKAMKIRDKARRTTSLDALVEVAGDASRALIDSRVASLDAQADLARLSEDPIAARAIAAAEGGAAPYVAPRGVHHPCARYTDEQVKRVRELHGQGRTYKEIEELTGVPAGYCPALVKRSSRPVASSAGWTRQLAMEAIRRFERRVGRVPRMRDAVANLTMPCPTTAARLFGSWQEAVRAAGLEPAYGRRRIEPWTDGELIRAFCDWRLRHQRWPRREDMVADEDLPSPATTRRRFGTVSPERLVKVVLSQLA